jgi:hypothetical protein
MTLRARGACPKRETAWPRLQAPTTVFNDNVDVLSDKVGLEDRPPSLVSKPDGCA